MEKIAAALGAARRGKISATAGYFGAMQLLAEIETRFRVPARRGPAHGPTLDRASARPSGTSDARAVGGDYDQSARARRPEHRTDAARGALAREDDRTDQRRRSQRSCSSAPTSEPLITRPL